jgi:flagellin
MSDISLSKAVRSNLLSLQDTATMMAKTQERLATGNKVNSALDNPTNFFTASSLNSRANDLNALMDSMANGIQTLEAADNGLTSITKTLESMQSTLRQARQDKSFQTQSYTVPTTGVPGSALDLDLTGGAFATAKSIALTKTVGGTTTPADAGTLSGTGFTTLDISGGSDEITFDLKIDGGAPTTITIDSAAVTAYNTTNGTTLDDGALTAADVALLINDQAGSNVATVTTGGQLKLTSGTTGTASSVEIDNFAQTATTGTTGLADGTDSGAAASTTGGTLAWKTIDELVSDINSNTDTKGKIRASNDNGKLRIENLSTQELNIDGISSTGAIDGTSTAASSITGNTVRSDLAQQFNELRDQLDKLADDASFNGINLLRGDLLRITFNETGTSSIDIQTKDEGPLDSASLNVFDISAADLDSDANIDEKLASLKLALNDVRSQSGTFGSNLSIVQNRQDFTKEMINTLETGAANLTLADMNEEAANLLALQTRQSLSSSSLSLASQADQSVLQLLQ